MDISYEYYRIFYYAAKYKNLTQAAQALHTNQPGISRTIKLLEHALGCPLMLRSNRGVSLTAQGERLYAHLKIAVEQIQTAETEIAAAEGSVSIGVSESALRICLLPALKTFKAAYPNVHIRIVSNLTIQAIAGVENGLVDFSLATTPVHIKKPLRQTTVFEYEDVLICSPSSPLLQKAPVALKETLSYPLISLGEHTVTHEFYQDFYRSHGLDFSPSLEAAATDQIIPMVKNDLGMGFLPASMVKEAIEKGEVCQIPLLEEIPKRQIRLIENNNYPLSKAAASLKKLLEASEY